MEPITFILMVFGIWVVGTIIMLLVVSPRLYDEKENKIEWYDKRSDGGQSLKEEVAFALFWPITVPFYTIYKTIQAGCRAVVWLVETIGHRMLRSKRIVRALKGEE